MQNAIGPDFKYKAPRQEVTFVYQQEEIPDTFGKTRIVNVEDTRPTWWPRSVLVKEHKS